MQRFVTEHILCWQQETTTQQKYRPVHALLPQEYLSIS